MSETKPTSDQVRFISANTGSHTLDTYIEACERSGVTLADMLNQIFGSDGSFLSDSTIELRIKNPGVGIYTMQYRIGDFTDPEAGWVNITPSVFEDILDEAESLRDSAQTHATSASTSASTALTHRTAAEAAQSAAEAAALAAQNAASGLKFTTDARLATTANITLSGNQTIDTKTTATNDRVVVLAQTNKAENGVYLAQAGAWVRATDADTWNEHIALTISITDGSANKNKIYICTAQSGGTLGTTDIQFVAFPTVIAPGSINDVSMLTDDLLTFAKLNSGAIATKANIEAEAASKLVTANLLKNHPGVCKAWVNFNGTGTVAIRDSYNVSSITDNGVGDYTINLTNAMANANYSVVGTCEGNSANLQIISVATGSFRIMTRYVPTNTATDVSIITASIFGDLA